MNPSYIAIIVTASATAIATGLFGAILGYVKGINSKLEDIQIKNAEYMAMTKNHATQFRDVWEKLAKIDAHLENTDREVAIIKRDK